MSNKKIGFIGAGNMATAIINGMIGNKAKEPSMIYVFDLDNAKLDIMKQKGVNACASANEAVEKSDIIVLAVKPQNYEEVLLGIKSSVTAEKVFVTIAAGISISYVTETLGVNCPAVRVMPNTPLLLGYGATAMCRSENISDEDFNEIYKMFSLSGEVCLFSESKMNEVISINGSSPAYFYLFALAMKQYAEEAGFDGETALKLIAKTMEGSAHMILESGDSLETLIQKVSSKGGTTIAALDVMKSKGIPEAINEGMAACTKRAEELGK